MERPAPPATPRPLELRTARLVLRAWRDDDADAFAALNADPRVMEHFPAPLTRAESDAGMARIREVLAERGCGLWALEVVGGARFIGFAGLGWPSFPPVAGAVEVAWRLAAEHWGRGYATEAARAAVDAAFLHLGLDEVVSFTVPANQRSRRVMEKLGMRHDPAGDFDHPRVPPGSALVRHVLYRLDRERWAAARGTPG